MMLLATTVAAHAQAPKPAPPVVRIARVTGGEQTSLKPRVMTRKLGAYLGSIRRCYARTLERDANARGRATFTFTVNAVGKVERSRADAFDQVLTSCLMGLPPKWKFPIPTSTYAEPTTAEYKVVIDLAPPPPPPPPAPPPDNPY